MQHHNLETFAQGALSKVFNAALEEVTKNTQDPNTDATKERKITLTIKLKPNDSREFVETTVESKVALAPRQAVRTTLNMGQDPVTGEVDCVEIGGQLPGQMSFEEVEQEQENTDKSKVVDLRAAK